MGLFDLIFGTPANNNKKPKGSNEFEEYEYGYEEGYEDGYYDHEDDEYDEDE